MLLLMVNTERDKLCSLWGRLIGEKLLHTGVNMRAVGHHVLKRRTGQHAASGARVALSHGVIIGVEHVLKVSVEFFIAAKMRLQDEAFEEPGDVRQMPFCRARIVHRLHGCVGIGQGNGQRPRIGAHVGILAKKLLPGVPCT